MKQNQENYKITKNINILCFVHLLFTFNFFVNKSFIDIPLNFVLSFI